MLNRFQRAWLFGSFGALVLTADAERAAFAQDKQACVKAYEEGQQLRKDGKLTSARPRLLLCAQETCPAVLRKDCTVWVSEIEHATPTVTLAARGPSGKDVVDVAVSLDGKPLMAHLDGKALPIDPGPHTFRFELAGELPREETILVKEGERNRAVLVDFQPPDARARASMSSASSSGSSSSASAPMRPRGIPAGAWVFGLAGVAGIATGLVFDVRGLNDKSKLDACKPYCDDSAVSAVRTKFIVGDIALGAGLVSLTVATILYATRGYVASESGLRVDVAPTIGAAGGNVRIGGSF